jgi:signal transduction histidine kinase
MPRGQSIPNSFLKLFQPPVYSGDPEKTRVAGILNALILVIGGAGLMFLLIGVPFVFGNKDMGAILSICLFAISPLAWILMRQNRIQAASLVIVLGLHFLVNAIAYLSGGGDSKAYLLYALLVVLPFLLLSARGTLISTLAASFAVAVFSYLSWAGLSPPKILPGPPLSVGFISLVVLWVIFLAASLSRDGWKKSRDEARRELAKRVQSDAEKEKLEEQLFQSRKMESLGRMAGTISHDSINLLSAISMRLQIVRRKRSDDAALASEIEKAEEAVQSAVNFARSLLIFFKKSEPRLVKIELDPMIRQSLPVLKDLLAEVRLETTLGAPGALVMADKTGVEQVLQNLAVNAREAMAKGGEVSLQTLVTDIPSGVSAAPPGPYFLIKFRDNGCGMNWETKDKIFEPFFTTKAHGMGLGLATVFGVVRQHKGFIEVDSTPGTGTEFRIYLAIA